MKIYIKIILLLFLLSLYNKNYSQESLLANKEIELEKTLGFNNWTGKMNSIKDGFNLSNEKIHSLSKFEKKNQKYFYYQKEKEQ